MMIRRDAGVTARRDMLTRMDRSALPAQFLLFAALYGAYGALSPFLPAFLKDRGLSAQEIASLLAGAMLVRMAAGPLIGRLADRDGTVRGLLALALVAAGGLTLAFLPWTGFAALLAIGLVQAVATAPLAPLADTLALAAAQGGRAFRYGWVRAAGSVAFIAMSVLTGWLVGWLGPASGLALGGTLFVLAAGIALRIQPPTMFCGPRPYPEVPVPREESWLNGFRALFALARFRRLVLAAACIIGAHAMHDAFAVIVWSEAGIGPGAAGLLWAESVAAEVAAFLWFGPRLVAGLGPGRVLALCALAAALRWAVQAETSWLPALAAIQALPGLTFASLHLACLAGIEASVPVRLRATALSVYGNLGLGLASALTTLAAGPLYAAFGQTAFLAMSGLSLAALPFVYALVVESPVRACVSVDEHVQTENKHSSVRSCPRPPTS